ncbi:MAG: hypothetical protein KF681_10175 [Bdellovibrionaceae bacterium]|nr:hypothetical protein [Pseudobdellovibrionaceae bacterium]
MKSWKVFWTVVVVGSVLSMGLTACGKKDNGNNTNMTYGSMSSDGQNATSNSTIAGMALNLQIRNIQPMSGYNAVRFDLALNGMVQSVQSQSQFVNYQQMGQVYVSHAAACTDMSCSTTYVTVLVAGTTYGCNSQYQQCQFEYRQYAVKKTGGSISGVREWAHGSNSYGLLSLQQVMSQF